MFLKHLYEQASVEYALSTFLCYAGTHVALKFSCLVGFLMAQSSIDNKTELDFAVNLLFLMNCVCDLYPHR